MKIGILSFQTRNFENYGSVEMLAERITANGHDATIILASELELQFGSTSSILLRGEMLGKFDIVIVRPRIIADPSIATTYMRMLESKGQILLNGSDSVPFTKNKIETLQMLSNAGIAIPRTSVLSSFDELDNVIKHFDFPIVIKTVYGSYGTGVFYADSMKTLRPIVDFQFNRGQYNDPLMIQEFIEEADNRDTRAFVVGDKVVAAMKRTAVKGDFRANYSRGGTVRGINISKDQEVLAIAAARCLKLDYAGVDMIDSKSGPLVLEVNSNPGFTGIMEASGVDVADEIVKYAIELAGK